MTEVRTYMQPTGVKGRKGVISNISVLSDGRIRLDNRDGDILVASLLFSEAEWTALRAQPAPPPTPAPDPIPIPGWKEIFRDEFVDDIPEGTFRSRRAGQWTPYGDDWPDMSHVGVRDSRCISQSGGLLRIHHGINADGKAMAPAIMPKLSGGPFTALRWEMRIKADPLPNYYAAPLLWPDSENWPTDGEIDWPEGGYMELAKCFMHRQDGTSGSDQDVYVSSARLQDWHTYALEWKAGKSLALFLDGTKVKEWTFRVPTTAMHPVLQTETYPGKGQPPASQTGYLLVDYVSIGIPS